MEEVIEDAVPRMLAETVILPMYDVLNLLDRGETQFAKEMLQRVIDGIKTRKKTAASEQGGPK